MIPRDNLAVVLGMFETGLAVGRSLGRVGIRVLGLDTSKTVGFYSKYIKASLSPHPLEQEESFIQFLQQIAASEKVRPVLFITSDEFLLPVVKNRQRLEEHFLLNLPNLRLIECISDKFKQYKLAVAAGIPVPDTYLVNNIDDLVRIRDHLTFPVFVKGSEVTTWRKNIGVNRKGFVAHTQKDLVHISEMIFTRGVGGLVQEIIPGPDTNHFKVCCYVSQAGEILLRFALQKIRQQPVSFGFGCLVKSLHYPDLLTLGGSLFEKIGYRGVGSAEFKLDPRDGQLKLIELNPRYWQQNELADKCGMNFPLVHYLDVTGGSPQAIPQYRLGLKWINISADFDSFREYRKRGELSLMEWLKSMHGPKVFSVLSSDDILPGVCDILFHTIFPRAANYGVKRLRTLPTSCLPKHLNRPL